MKARTTSLRLSFAVPVLLGGLVVVTALDRAGEWGARESALATIEPSPAEGAIAAGTARTERPWESGPALPAPSDVPGSTDGDGDSSDPGPADSPHPSPCGPGFPCDTEPLPGTPSRAFEKLIASGTEASSRREEKTGRDPSFDRGPRLDRSGLFPSPLTWARVRLEPRVVSTDRVPLLRTARGPPPSTLSPLFSV